VIDFFKTKWRVCLRRAEVFKEMSRFVGSGSGGNRSYGNVPPPSQAGGAGSRFSGGGNSNSSSRFNVSSVPSSVANSRGQKRDYFDDDDDEMDYRKVSTTAVSNNTVGGNSNDDDYDPLEAFMQGVQEQVSKEKLTVGQYKQAEIVSAFDAFDDAEHDRSSKRSHVDGGNAAAGDTTNDNDDDDDDDDDTGHNKEDEDENEYDSDGVLVSKKKVRSR
jgi:hypothetical protein